MEMLRNPQKFRQQTQQVKKAETVDVAQVAQKTSQNKMAAVVGGVVLFLVLTSLLFVFSAQKRAGNISSAVDSSVLKGLVVDRTFNPTSAVKYVQISEGQERNVTARESGSTLPVISRYNYRALTKDSYGVIGAAPWALSINVTSNLQDPDLLRYLFNNEDVVEKFLARPDVAPLLADPAALAKAAQDQNALNKFFTEDAVKEVLASPQLLNALAGSRLFSYLLISKSVRYYRDRPAEAAKLINSSPALAALKRNPNVRKEVAENNYLKKISATLLK